MNPSLRYLLRSVLQLFYPHLCPGCGSDALEHSQELCIQCSHQLPETGFERHANNPVEKLFWGRIPMVAASSAFYFSKGTLMQTLLHAIKYGGHQALAIRMGKEMGRRLLQSDRFSNLDGIVPVPLHKKRQYQRGYNQSSLLAQGIETAMGVPTFHDALVRTAATATQTKKSRLQRWQNVQYTFKCPQAAYVRGKDLLLIDDVITTGATLEACGQCLLDSGASSIHIATLAYASQ